MSPLWLHVFGRGYGESLVLALPNGDWGVLDCYAPSVLCGDAESRNWEIILVDVGTANLTAAGIKIGHHGATSGYIDGLWPAFSAAGKPVAVLTTWYRGGKTLPQRAALEHLRPYLDNVRLA